MTDYLLDDEGLIEFKKKYDARIKNTASDIIDSYNNSNANCGIVGAKGLFDIFGGLIFGVNEEGEPGFRVGFDGEFISFGGKCLMEKLLWTNPDIAQTEFDTQTVEIDLSSFDYVGVEYWHKGQGSDVKIAVFPISNDTLYTAIGSTQSGEASSEDDYYLTVRPIQISKTGIHFNRSSHLNFSSEAFGTNTKSCVPIRIFALQ